MARDERARSPRPALRGFWRLLDRSGLLIPAVFLVLMAWLAPISNPAEFDTDEGVNLMKALLVSRGHALYTEIWSDQPPGLTLLLAETIRIFGASVDVARVLVLLFSALLIWSFFQTVRISTSRAAALLGVLLLLFSAWYVRLSIAVMVGLPALALAMLSTYLFLLSRSRARSPFLLASGLTLAFAMQTKLLAGILAPVLLAYALFVADVEVRQPVNWRRRVLDGTLWSGSLLISFAVVGAFSRSFDLSQLVQPHLGSGVRSAFGGDNLPAIGGLLLREIGLLPFALAGIICSLREGRKIVWLPLGWCLVALAFLIYEKPLWYHHVTALTLPLAWLGALGAGAWVGALRKGNPAWKFSPGSPPSGARSVLLVAAAGIVCLYLLFFSPFTARPRVLGELSGLAPSYDEQVAAFIRQGYAGQPGWVFTDRPIYAFRAGLSVPPPSTVLTVKRMRSAGVSDREMAAVIESYRPELVVLERFRPDYGPVFRAALSARYEPLWTSPTAEVWAPGLPAALRQGAAGAGYQRHQFDGWLTLAVSDSALPAHVRAGEDLHVNDLWWLRAGDRAGSPLAVSLRFVDQTGQVWSQRDTSVGTELVDLRSRSHVRQTLSTHVPEELPAGDYQVVVVVYDPQTGQPLASSSGAGAEGASALLGWVTADKSSKDNSRPSLALAARRALADFGPLRLLQASTPATMVSPGDAVPVSLTWQAASSFGGDALVVVVQLLDDHDRVVASLEEEPLAGRYPTAHWQPGELVGDRHDLTVPQGTHPGRYRLAIGLYRAVDRVRLSAGAGFLGLMPWQYFPAGTIEVR